jgi:6-pyruvoyltetrahydropterin/6-carboxytetrahydropterin synthase
MDDLRKTATTITVSVDFCYGHRLLDYVGKCQHLHGHNGRVEITVMSRGLNKSGFVIDFSDVKTFTKEWIDTEWDHRMQLNEEDPMVPAIASLDEKLRTVPFNPTAEKMASELYDEVQTFLRRQFRDATRDRELELVSVRFWETPTSFAEVFDGLGK